MPDFNWLNDIPVTEWPRYEGKGVRTFSVVEFRKMSNASLAEVRDFEARGSSQIRNYGMVMTDLVANSEPQMLIFWPKG